VPGLKMVGVLHLPRHMPLWCALLQLLTVPFFKISQQLQHIPHLVLKVLPAQRMNNGI